MLASAMAAAKKGADALDDKYSREAAESLPFAELVDAPSSIGSSYGSPRLDTFRQVSEETCGFSAGVWKRLRLAGSTCSGL